MKDLEEIAVYVKDRVYHAMFDPDVKDMDRAIEDAIMQGLRCIAFITVKGSEIAPLVERKSGKGEI